MAKFSLSRSKGSSKGRADTTVRSGGKVFISVAIVAALILAGTVFYILSQITSTSTYYVLNQDVTARSQVTSEMLTPVTTSKGGEPLNSLNPSHLEAEEVYAKYALSAGDILTPSNVGLHSPIQEGIPADHVVASFTAPAENAVAGKIRRGDYIDIIAVGEHEENTSAQYVLRNVLVLDATANLDVEATAEVAAEDAETRAGIPTLYTVSLPEHHAVRLAMVQDQALLVVLTPVDYDGEDDSNFVNWNDVFGADSTVEDSGFGTDSTFSGEAGEEAEPAESDDEGAEETPADDEGGSDEEEAEPVQDEEGSE